MNHEIPKSECTIYDTYCSRHEFHHGAEAEELRSGIEKLIAEGDQVCCWQLQRLLDRVDARDSLAYLEATDGADDGFEAAKTKERP